MVRFPWTKLQDFYVRLGFLNVLLAAVSAERRSVFADALIRRLETPLFLPAKNVPALGELVNREIVWYKGEHGKGRKLDQPSVAEALLVMSDHPSYLYAITKKSTYKIVDWGRDVELLGAGNQITERGLLIRSLIPAENAEKFLAGDVLAWNPFSLGLREKLLFFYHLSEIDHVLLELASDFAEWSRQKPMESADAAHYLCRAMLRVLSRSQGQLRPQEVPAFSVARDLGRTIALELSLEDAYKAADLMGSQSGAVAVPRLPPSKKTMRGAGSRTIERVGHKNADHQTIPRAEQLVDLGFLQKPASESTAAAREGNRRWRYQPTQTCVRWRDARRILGAKDVRLTRNETFLREGFAKCAVHAFHGSEVDPKPSRDVGTVATHLWRAYERIGRRHGNSPLDSIALFAMTSAAAEGIAIEMACFERFMNAIKAHSALPEHVFFAGGNDLDTMFIRLKPGFLTALEANKSPIQTEYSSNTS